LTLNESFLRRIEQCKFFISLLKVLDGFDNDRIVKKVVAELLGLFGGVGYCDEYLLFSQRLRAFVYDGDKDVAQTGFRALYVLSFHEKCARRYRDMRLDEDLKELFGGQSEKLRVGKFKSNLYGCDSEDDV
jgi:hypothetical protein